MPGALLAVPVEDSRAQRQQRLQSKFRDRGGIFVPSGKNELVEILLARAVNGESPPRSIAKDKAKGRAKSRSRSPVKLVKVKGKNINVETDVKKAAAKKRAPSVQESESEVIAGSTRPPAAKKSTRNGRAEVAAIPEKPTETAPGRRAKTTKSVPQQYEGTGATDSELLSKPTPSRKARARPPSKSKSQSTPLDESDDDDEGTIIVPVKPNARSAPSRKTVKKPPQQSYATDPHADKTDTVASESTAKAKSNILPQTKDSQEPSTGKKRTAKKAPPETTSRKRRRIGQPDSEDEGPEWKPQLENKAATRVRKRKGKKVEQTDNLKPSNGRHELGVISEDEEPVDVDKAKSTKPSASKSTSKQSKSEEKGPKRSAHSEARGPSDDEDEEFVLPTKVPRKRPRQDLDDQDDASLVKPKTKKSRLPQKSAASTLSTDGEGSKPGAPPKRLRSKTPTNYLELSEDEEDAPRKRGKGPPAKAKDAKKTLSVISEVDEDEGEGPHQKQVKKRKKALDEDDGTDLRPKPSKRPRSKDQTTPILDIEEGREEASPPPQKRRKNEGTSKRHVDKTKASIDTGVRVAEEEDRQRPLKKSVQKAGVANERPVAAASKSKAKQQAKPKPPSRNVKKSASSVKASLMKTAPQCILDTPDSRLDYDSEPDPLDLLS